MSDRCECGIIPLIQGSIWPTCPVHGDPDAILASGSYTDRRGTWWGYMRGIDRWVDR